MYTNQVNLYVWLLRPSGVVLTLMLSSFRSIRNIVIDTRRIPPQVPAIALHWQVSQATSLLNLVIHMSAASNTEHQGIMMENGRQVV